MSSTLTNTNGDTMIEIKEVPGPPPEETLKFNKMYDAVKRLLPFKIADILPSDFAMHPCASGAKKTVCEIVACNIM